MLRLQIGIILMLIACAVFTSCDRVQKIVMPTQSVEEVMPPAPAMDNILKTYKSWQYAQPLPAPPATFTEAKDSGSAHGLGDRTVYIDGIDHTFFYAIPAAVDAGMPVVFPAGMTLVKEIMDDTNTFVWRVAVMQKTEDVKYTDHNGWQYVQYQRESETDSFLAKAGDETEKGSTGCHGCHAKATHDSVFVTEILMELGRARLEALQARQGNTGDNNMADEDDMDEN